MNLFSFTMRTTCDIKFEIFWNFAKLSHFIIVAVGKNCLKRKKIWNASRICVSSLRRGHANLLCIVPILIYVLPEQTQSELHLAYHHTKIYLSLYILVAHRVCDLKMAKSVLFCDTFVIFPNLTSNRFLGPINWKISICLLPLACRSGTGRGGQPFCRKK